jgi:WD40 repeat protein
MQAIRTYVSLHLLLAPALIMSAASEQNGLFYTPPTLQQLCIDRLRNPVLLEAYIQKTAEESACNNKKRMLQALFVDKKMSFARGDHLLHTLNGHTGYVHSVAFDPKSGWLASGSDDGTVKLWDLASGKCVRTLEHDAPIIGVDFDATGTKLLSMCHDQTTMSWNFFTGTPLSEIANYGSSSDHPEFAVPACSVVFNSSGSLLAIASGKEISICALHQSNLQEVLQLTDEELATLFTALRSGSMTAKKAYAHVLACLAALQEKKALEVAAPCTDL